ncbi:hypothetical protein FHS85_001519 [Rhodoligotrophos appendicifer]
MGLPMTKRPNSTITTHSIFAVLSARHEKGRGSGLAASTCVHAIVTDAMEAARQDIEQETTVNSLLARRAMTCWRLALSRR